MKNCRSKTLNSAIWYMISNIIAKGFSVLITPIIARILTKQEYGIYSNFVSWQSMITILLTLELSSTVLRAKIDYEGDDFKTYISSVSLFSILWPLILSSVLLILFMDAIVNTLKLTPDKIYALQFITIFAAALPIFQAEQRSFVKYKISSVVTITYGTTSLFIPLLLTRFISDQLNAIILGIVVNAAVWGSIIYAYCIFRVKMKFRLQDLKYALVIAVPIVPHILAGSIMGNSDKVMINSMCGPEYAAIYGIVFTCSLCVTLLKSSLNSAWVTWFYENLSRKQFTRIREKSSLYINFFSIMTVIFCLAGPEIILILGGAKYADAMWLMPVIMLRCYYEFLYTFYVNLEFYEKKTVIISKITIVTTILNLIMNYFGIKIWGYQAAAYTTAIATLLTVIFHYMSTKKMGNSKIYDNKRIWQYALIMTVIMFSILFIYNIWIIRWIILLVFSGIFLLKAKKVLAG